MYFQIRKEFRNRYSRVLLPQRLLRVVHTNLDIFSLLGLLYYSSPFSQHSSVFFFRKKSPIKQSKVKSDRSNFNMHESDQYPSCNIQQSFFILLSAKSHRSSSQRLNQIVQLSICTR
jgi:hypothetical protein